MNVLLNRLMSEKIALSSLAKAALRMICFTSLPMSGANVSSTCRDMRMFDAAMPPTTMRISSIAMKNFVVRLQLDMREFFMVSALRFKHGVFRVFRKRSCAKTCLRISFQKSMLFYLVSIFSGVCWWCHGADVFTHSRSTSLFCGKAATLF